MVRCRVRRLSRRSPSEPRPRPTPQANLIRETGGTPPETCPSSYTPAMRSSRARATIAQMQLPVQVDGHKTTPTRARSVWGLVCRVER
eukprot:3941036-Rhodomonas_salina.1